MQFKRTIIALTGCLFTLSALAQEKNKTRFGKITPEDFQKTRYELDTGAHAVVLADIGSTEFDTEGDHFTLSFKHFRRVKILDKTGYEAANEEIYLYGNGDKEQKLTSLKAACYNLENGQVVETKMDSKDVFTQEIDKEQRVKKFTLPAVKEGAIVEYSYTIIFPYVFILPPWAFQGEYPVLWSEYSVGIPEMYEYVFIAQGYQKFETKTREDARKNFSIHYDPKAIYGTSSGQTERINVNANVSTFRWVAKDVPVLKEEGFTTSLLNHITRIDFQLAAIKYPDNPVHQVMGTWQQLAKEIMKREDYGVPLDNYNGFLGDIVAQLTRSAATDEEKARNIYAYVRNNYACTDYDELYMQKTLKSVFTGRNGNVTEVNLLLVAMLRKAGLTAYPVILSTRRNGYTNAQYPLISKFNYTIADVELADGPHYLDAAHALGFGKLHASCYNGHARILDTAARAVQFNTDSLPDQKTTSIFMVAGKEGMKGTLQQWLSYNNSYNLRGLIHDKGKEAYFNSLAKAYPKLSGAEITDLDSLDAPVIIKYDFALNTGEEDLIYFNPMLGEAMESNPFKSQQRFYPVEMPAKVDHNYVLNMEIPAGYEVEELPKSALVKFNEGEGVFQYVIEKTDKAIQFRSRIRLNKTYFAPDEYESLRSFYDMIVKKQNEQIVLKKKK
ncbi:Transglutaminase-like enzyme, putative cysteine protease [Chitinophaga rupis]|uniref:Transglutaminase-like enzyme, putative cysteine protease n=1 Tax=Chitinophaga rupis TaxID=573321 RepID=A0A1H8FF80_9BACT|nr:DUF3857 domain-containing protein [Chitinophaga rupis]SEN29837.1 Transglutaminase-like enzyme, putative cysteine protease [Chitinophaga rupis]